jgi:pimeloyl-ACP methyl ester carboxylesterase
MQATGCIVFIGRKNDEKRFTAFTQLTDGLAALGLPLLWFESDRAKASYRAEAQITAWTAFLGNTSAYPIGRFRRSLRFVLKSIILLTGKQRWLFIRDAFKSHVERTTDELRGFLEGSPYDEFLLVAHSAGAIAATKVADHRKVRGLLCFGYPFKHPDRSAEHYRTAHLLTLTKPLLIVQGKSDDYGADPDMLRPLLPPHSRIVSPACDHDYLDLGETDFALIWDAIIDLMREADFTDSR